MPIDMSSSEQILDAAETRMRSMGYNAVSYRDIAADVGVKSASLHYHFPKKADLGVALVRRYAKNFHNTLAEETSSLSDPARKITVFIDLHRRALKNQGLICLCAVFGAEAQGLPKDVTKGVRVFFEANIKWLAKNYREAGVSKAMTRAKAGVSLLEGALMIAIVNNDPSIFEAAAETVQL